MLKKLYPEAFGRYLALPLFGSMMEDFDNWLIKRGHTRRTRVQLIWSTAKLDEYFQELGRHNFIDLTSEDFDTCLRHHLKHRRHRPTTLLLRLFFEYRNLLARVVSEPAMPFRSYLEPYGAYLRDVRGFAPNTIQQHVATLRQFLYYLERRQRALSLADLAARDLEDFIVLEAKRLGRGSMQHLVSHLRGFLRYLVMKGEVRPGLEAQMDTPRQYRLEKLPRALPWETVQSFLGSIDRRKPSGLRDYAVFLMMATYGLRASDIVRLPFNAVRWRQDEIRIQQQKTGEPLVLPLTDSVGDALLEYLRKGRPDFSYRELFISVYAPIHPVRHTAVNRAFQYWVMRSGLKIPFTYGPGCLRHSYAVHLLRQGVSVKTIGDLLGHRTLESTCVYLRMDVEDLREVALSLPKGMGEGVR